MRLTNNLAAERHARGWSQAHVAELGGISRQSYAAIESGDAVPSTEIALRLAGAFGRRVEELFRLPAAGAERVQARWAGAGSPVGRRVRLARVAGRVVALDAAMGERVSRLADGVVTGEVEDDVEVTLFASRGPEPDLVVAGCDPAFGLIVDALQRDRGVEVAWVQRGSRSALEALARGEAHVAGAHLRDPGGVDFNTAWVTEVVPFACTRVTFAIWEQGLLVGTGNPKGIASVEDLARSELRFLNREVGSGSRALLDDRLATGGIPAEAIPGYGTSARSHFGVAEAIASGLADAGVAIRAAGNAYGLETLTLAFERYELIIPDHFLDLPAVQALLDALRLPTIRTQVEALGGYDAAEMGRSRQ